MANQGINYTSRNFADIRSGLIDMVRQYYPDIFNDFNDASVGMMILELNAAVGDMLSFNTDRMFQETQIDYAQERKSVLSMARTFGLKIPGKRPSITIVDFSVTVPVFGDTFDISYAPIIAAGSQVTGAGKVFETSDDIDFSSPFTIGGIPNRLIIPNFDSNNTLINYTLVKREIVINGFTKIFKRILTSTDVKPFLEIVLPDNNVLSIDSVITLDGTDFTKDPAPEQFLDLDKRWFEMDALAEDKVFIEDATRISDNAGVRPGKWISVTRKLITEYTDLGFLKLILGGGTQDTSSLCDFDTNKALVNQIGDFVNNMSLGVTPTANTTMFVKYRVGGGSDSNVGPNVLKSTGVLNITVNGSNPTINNAVKASLKVNNAFPALGGRNVPSVEEVRNLVRYNFASQNRAVTIKDYQSRISLMPGKFGVPFRSGVFEEQNKVKVYILGLDANSKLTNESTSALKDNISEYLADYRMLNDYVQISNGRIINLGFQIDLYIDKKVPSSQIVSQVISAVQSYMDINKFQMGDSIYLSSLIETINNVGGVTNVIDLRVYNKVGEGKYSVNEISQPYIDTATRQIDVSNDYTLFGEPTSMFEIKYPTTDIMVRVKS
jgi:hypothetical protein